MSSVSRLEAHLATFPSVLVGFSGGVDSSLVAVAARRVLGRERALAAIGVSPSLAANQHEQAVGIARQFDLALVEVATREFEQPAYVANAPDRCYHCKQELWRVLTDLARERGLAAVCDGTNADDGSDHRPGARAGREFAIHSPLADLGYTKRDVRREAETLSIPIWDAPAAPCLSSRVMYGLEVRPDRLRQVEASESLLVELGIKGDLRVRHRGDEARIEVIPSQFDRVRAHRARIAARFRELGFDRVTMDLDGYRRGSLLTRAAERVEPLMEPS
jgi:uncharacterized protein